MLNPKISDRHVVSHFAGLTFQYVVNIGVRDSKPIQARVMQAGRLDLVRCMLEAWLASKGFAVGHLVSVTGAPRESREQRQLRRQLRHEQQLGEHAQELARLVASQRVATNEVSQKRFISCFTKLMLC